MRASSRRRRVRRLGVPRQAAAATLAASLIATLAAMPTASAIADSTAAAPRVAGTGVSASLVEVPTGGLGALLAGLPVSDLGLGDAQLATLIAGLEGGALSGQAGALTTAITGLLGANPDATLGELTEGLLTGGGLLGTLLQTLLPELEASEIVGALDPQQLVTFLGNLTAGLDATQLAEVVSGLAGSLSPEQLASLQPIITALTGALSNEGLTQLLTDLQGLPTGLGEGELATLEPAQLATLIDGLFATASAGQLEPVVADLLGGLTWSSQTTGSLAEGFGVPLETFAGDLGETAEGGFGTLPTMMSELPGSGQVVGLLDRAKGLALGLLGTLGEGEGQGEGKGGEPGGGGSGGSGGSGGGSGGSGGSGSGSGGSSGNGGSGGAGGQGAGGSPAGGMTIVVSVPLTQTTPTSAPRPVGTSKTRGIRIISHRVKGHVATLELDVPAAGSVKVTGPGVRAARRTLGKAGRVTIHVALSRAGTARLRGHRGAMSVRLKASFKPRSGASSTATTKIGFR